MRADFQVPEIQHILMKNYIMQPILFLKVDFKKL